MNKKVKQNAKIQNLNNKKKLNENNNKTTKQTNK